MKTSVPKLAIMAAILFSFQSSLLANFNFYNTIRPLVVPTGEYTGCYVELTDGTLKKYASLKLVTGVFKAPHLLADDSIVINTANIRAYQNEMGYAISQKEFTEGRKSYVSKNVLPGFALRVVKGYINVYSLKYYNGHNTTEKFYLQNGDEGQIVSYTPELLLDLLKENPDALAMLTAKNKEQAVSKRLIIAVEVFNNSKVISKN
jgi:hypothetical protein